MLPSTSNWEEIEGLEDEADLPISMSGEFVVVEAGQGLAGEDVLTGLGRVQQPDDVQKRALPGPR